MRIILLLFLFFFFTEGCKRSKKIPQNILPPQTMQKIMWDMIKADEFLTAFVLSKDSSRTRKNESFLLYGKILRIYGISGEKFRESFSFYRTHPAFLKVVFDSLSAGASNALNEESRTRLSFDSTLKKPGKQPVQ